MKAGMQSQPLLVTSILDHAARWDGEQVVVSRLEEGPLLTVTYRDVHERARLCALALQQLGVKAGDRVGTLAWNSSRHLEAWYGVMGLGAVVHTLNPRLFAADLEYIINHAEDCVLMLDVCFAELAAQLRPKLTSVKAFVVLTDRGSMHRAEAAKLGPALCYEDIIEAQRPRLPGFRWARMEDDDACGLCYTSGTTGRPKGVLYSHRAQVLHALSVAMPDALNLCARSIILAIVPMFHANAWGLTFAAPLTGAKLVLPGPFLDGDSLYQLMEEQRCNFAAAVPTVFLALLQYLKEAGRQLHHLKIANIGGAACPLSLTQALQDEHGVEVRHMWGMTELTPIGTLGGFKGTLPEMSAQEKLALQAKQGRPSYFIDMRIVDDEGRELPHDGRAYGDLQVRGPHVVSHYFRQDGKPATDKDDWFMTGDVATIDALGHMAITDRSKDVIKSGGEWISSIDIENAVMAHPKVIEAAVIGIPDKKWTERPLLVVVPHPKSKPSKDELLHFLKGKVAKWWIPENVAFVDELPHTATGKLSKLTLRKQFKDFRPEQARL